MFPNNEPEREAIDASQVENEPQQTPPQPRGPQIPLGARTDAQQLRPIVMPRPVGFIGLLLKDVLATTFGVCLVFFMLFALLIGCGALLVHALENADLSDGGVSVTETLLRGEDAATKKVVVLPIEGVIETDEAGFIPTALDLIREDDEVEALVLRVNSPGGTISGSDYYLHLLKKLKKELSIPVVVSMGDMAASGGYYISTVGDKIYAERSTLTGSIGVIVHMYNAADLCKKIGVRSNAIVSGPMKDMGDFMKEPSPEETAIWQKNVDDSFEQFLSVIREGRPWFRGEDGPVKVATKREKVAGMDVVVEHISERVARAEEDAVSTTDAVDAQEDEVVSENDAQEPESAEETAVASEDKAQDAADEASAVASDLLAERDAALRKLADGRIYSAADAKELHLIDEIGYFDDAIDAAIGLAGLDKDDVKVVRLSESLGFFDSLAEVRAKQEPLGKALKTFAGPRAYYLAPRALPFEE